MALFRSEVLESQSEKTHGEILLLRPLSFAMLTTLAAGIALFIIFYLFFGSYTNKARLSGSLLPEHGLLKLYPKQAGEIVQVNVKEGQNVKKGDVLFILSGEHVSARGQTVTNLAEQIARRRNSLETDRLEAAQLAKQHHSTLFQRISKIKEEIVQIDTEIVISEQRSQLAAQILQRFEELKQAGFASTLQVHQKTDEHLAHQGVLHGLQRQRMSLQSELAAKMAESVDQPLVVRSQAAQILRTLMSVDQEAVEMEARRELRVLAPQDGKVVALTLERGQIATPQSSLASIIPLNDRLDVILYAPSRAVGFVRPGQQVLLRYQAYPYQKFGSHKGVVTHVSQAAFRPDEIDRRVDSGGASNESLYKITVRPEAQQLLAYGAPVALQTGMQVDADIHLDTRRLIEWICEPLLSITGRWK